MRARCSVFVASFSVSAKAKSSGKRSAFMLLIAMQSEGLRESSRWPEHSADHRYRASRMRTLKGCDTFLQESCTLSGYD